MDDRPTSRSREPEPVSKRVRRFSIFLILGIVAVVALAIWLATSWYSRHYYAEDGVTNLPPLPSAGAPAKPGAAAPSR